MANEQTGLYLGGIVSDDPAVNQLIAELDKQFNGNQIHLLSDDSSLTYKEIKEAIMGDIRHVTYNTQDLPTSWNFVVEQKSGDDVRGRVEIQYKSGSHDFRVSRMIIDVPVDTRFAELIVRWRSGKPWLIDDTELVFRGES